MLLLLAFPTADASGFRHAELPLTLGFQYDWTEPVVSGSTSFTFATAQLRDDTAACASSGGCMDGTFTTGNGGNGSFSTDVVVRDCVLRFAEYRVEITRLVVPGTCEVVQDLDLFYAQTSATYTGSAALGTVTFERLFDCSEDPSCPLDQDRAFSYRFVPMPFAGTLGGPGVGVFHEL